MAGMHVKLGRRGDYAVRISIDLARHWGGAPRKAREIALSMDIPTEFARQILADLVAHGLLSSAAGPRGGYRLVQPPDDVTLLVIIEAAEGEFGLQRCVLRGGPCDWTAACPVHEIWSNAQQAFADVLGASNLADLASIDDDIEHGTYFGASSQHIEEVVRRGTRS